MTQILKVGVMPGRIQEVAVDDTVTVSQALSLANLTTEGFEVKLDGNTVTDLTTSVAGANVLLLTKKVKGNASGIIKVGVMPGRIQEVAYDGQTVAQILDIAGLSTDGFEVKLDGATVTDLAAPVSGNVLLLTKKVKGN